MTLLGEGPARDAPVAYLAIHANVGYLNSLRAQFLNDAVAQGRVPVVVTDGVTRLTLPLVWALRRAGGVWAVEERDGQYRDGLTGRRIETLADVHVNASGETEFSPHSAAPMPPDVVDGRTAEARERHEWRLWQVRVSVRAQPHEGVVGRFGCAVETFVDVMQNIVESEEEEDLFKPITWGFVEPTGNAWDRGTLSQSLDDSQDDAAILVGDRRQPAVGEVRVGTSSTGVWEGTDVVLRRIGWRRDLELSIERTRRAFESLARVEMVSGGLVLGRFGQRDLTVRSHGEEQPEPMALHFGRAAVEGLPVDADELIVSMDASHTPDGGLYVPLAQESVSGWDRFAMLEEALGKEALGEFLARQGMEMQW